jgi:hypothetical protein
VGAAEETAAVETGERTDASRHTNSREIQNNKFRKFFILIFKFLTVL